MSNFGGFAGLHAGNNSFNEIYFLVSNMLGKSSTAALVRVEAVRGGGVGPIGRCDVKPLVYQMDAEGKALPHGVIHDLPYMRVQGGTRGAVICDPVVGDVGLAIFCDRDISSVKAGNGSPALPASRRMHDMADGLYLGAFIAATPEQYVHFGDGEVTVKAVSRVIIDAPELVATGAVRVEEDLAVVGSGTVEGDLTAAGVSVQNHIHSGVTAGTGQSGPPVP